MRNEVPDSWIERIPEDDGPQIEDACMVCGKIECICPSDDVMPLWSIILVSLYVLAFMTFMTVVLNILF